MKRETVGPVLLVSAAAIVVVGTLIEIWQDRDVHTISQSITLPTYVAMVGSIPLLSRGYRRVARRPERASTVRRASVGSLAGLLLWVGAFWWQVSVGLPGGDNLDLDSYAAAVVLFVGVAVLAQSVASLTRDAMPQPSSGPRTDGRAKESLTGPGASGCSRALLGVAWTVVGAALLAVTAATVGWVGRQLTHGPVLYLLVGTEIGGTGAWFLLVGYFAAARNMVAGRSRVVVRLSGLVCGAGLALVGSLWWPAPVLSIGPRQVASIALLVSGIGLLGVSVALRPPASSPRPQPPAAVP